MNKIFFEILWFFLSLFDKVYWFVFRQVQRQKLQTCGDDVFISRHCTFLGHGINIGNDVYVGESCRFQSTNAKIIIGNHVMFGPGVSIHGGDHRFDTVGKWIKEHGCQDKLNMNDGDVVIEDDVWIGAQAILLKGVRIGEGSIIGAGSVINKSVLPFSIVTGSKSQQVRPRWDSQTIERHKALIREKSLT